MARRSKDPIDYSPEACAARSAQVEEFLDWITDAWALVRVNKIDRKVLRRRWGPHIPVQALLAADLMIAVPEIFPGLGFGPEDLRRGEARVRDRTQLRGQIQGFIEVLSDLILIDRAGLHDQVRDVVDTVNALLACPGVPADLKRRVRKAARTLLASVKERNDGIQKTRKERARLRAEGVRKAGQLKEKIDKARLQGKVLRGGSSEE